MDPIIIIFGLGVGILVGTTGMGGGSIMTPLLILVIGTNPAVAIGTDLAYAAITKTVGGWRHLRAKTVDMRLSMWLAAGSLPGALVGVWLLQRLENALGADFDDTLMIMLAVTLLLTAVAVIARALFVTNLNERQSADLTTARSRAGTIAFGFVVGIVLGTTSAGQRRADRARPDHLLPARAAARRRHRRRACRAAAVGRGDGPRVRRATSTSASPRTSSSARSPASGSAFSFSPLGCPSRACARCSASC